MDSLIISEVIVIWILLPLPMETTCKDWCYYIDFIYSNWTDDRPRFTVNMTFSNQNGIASVTAIEDQILSPITSFLIIQQNEKEQKRVIYNMTSKLCAMKGILSAVPLFKPVKENMLKQSNYTFSCPLNKGVYVMKNMRVYPKNPLLGLLYQAKGIFTVNGGLYEELPNAHLHTLSTYNIAARIIKKNCGRNE